MTAVPTPAAGEREGKVAEWLERHDFDEYDTSDDDVCECGWRGTDHYAHVARALLAPDGPVGIALVEARRDALLKIEQRPRRDAVAPTDSGEGE